MSARGPGRVACLFGQRIAPPRSADSTGRRRTRDLHTQAFPPIKENMLSREYQIPKLRQLRRMEGDGPELPPDIAQDQLDLHSPVDLLREVLVQNMVPVTRHDYIRFPTQQALSLTPQPTTNSAPVKVEFPLSGDLLPHSEFRHVMKSKAPIRGVRKILREQFLRCQYPQDVLRIVAVAMQRNATAREMPRVQQSITRALYRVRNNVSDTSVLKTINVIVNRLHMANLPVPEDLVKLGIKFAARARSLSGMKRYLYHFKRSGQSMTRSIFRSTIAKFSIGTRGLGEIRNGRWKQKELLQVLLGFEDTPAEEAHHLGVFLDRDDWQFVHGWLAVLARCRAVDELWKEWQLWLASPARRNPKKLYGQRDDMNTRSRGDYWHVEQMALAGDSKKAWEMLNISGIPFASIRPLIQERLLEGAQYAPVGDTEVQKELLTKYSVELQKIETALGVKWVSHHEGCGYHAPHEDMENKLETLAAPDFELEPDYGYPFEESSAEELEKQRNIMEAEEQHE